MIKIYYQEQHFHAFVYLSASMNRPIVPVKDNWYRDGMLFYSELSGLLITILCLHISPAEILFCYP